MVTSSTADFEFPVGYRRFHPKQLYNFQLNRWYSLGYLSLEAMTAAGRSIKDFPSWRSEMRALGDAALDSGSLMQAAFFYRAAEFYTIDQQEREALSTRFAQLFYESLSPDAVEKHEVPLDGSRMHAIRVSAASSQPARGTIVLHGGFDSFIEEFYSLMRYLAGAGYDVIGFDGPGQGTTRRRHGLLFDYRWETPTGAILDHFGLEDVTLIGLSLGGWLCLRAAAFEKRIRRVIPNGHAYDQYKIPSALAQNLMTFFNGRFKESSNRIVEKNIKKGGMEGWQMSNLMYITGIEPPMTAFDYAMQMNEENLHCELVDQDVLLMTSRNDHFVPYKLHDRQVELLGGARSLTDRVFVESESAQNHCQIGNIGLALRTMDGWIQKTAGS